MVVKLSYTFVASGRGPIITILQVSTLEFLEENNRDRLRTRQQYYTFQSLPIPKKSSKTYKSSSLLTSHGHQSKQI
jgi:hypothetical protein